MVEYLLNKGAKVDTRDKLLRTPLHLACLKGNSTIAQILIRNSADPFERDNSGRTALHFACCSGIAASAVELTVVLCHDGTDLIHMKDHTGRTPLHYAVFNTCKGQVKIIEQLLRLGANINCLDVERQTPIHFAAESGNKNIIPILIQNGASVGIQDRNKRTPLQVALNDHIRELMIVYAPDAKPLPNIDEAKEIQIVGAKKPIKKVANLF